MFRSSVLLMATLAVGAVASEASGQSPSADSVWDGVYTDAEAQRGRTLFEGTCIKCHGQDTGGFAAKELYGDRFFEKWRENTLEPLYETMKTMPPAGPWFDDNSYRSILGYILWANGFPAGDNELDPATFATIRIEGEGGPQPLPDRAIAEVVGCFTRGEGSDWMLTLASRPIRARNTEQGTPEEVKMAQTRPLGTLTFGLGNFFMLGGFDSEAHEGHKMLVKGALARRDDGDRISLTAMDSLSPECRPPGG